MVSSTSFFLESEGITLPNGTVFGGGIEHKFDILQGENIPNMFTVYEYIGNTRISVTHGENWGYKQMREFVHAQVSHYSSCGMKLWFANNSEWDKATLKELVTENW